MATVEETRQLTMSGSKEEKRIIGARLQVLLAYANVERCAPMRFEPPTESVEQESAEQKREVMRIPLDVREKPELADPIAGLQNGRHHEADPDLVTAWRDCSHYLKTSIRLKNAREIRALHVV